METQRKITLPLHIFALCFCALLAGCASEAEQQAKMDALLKEAEGPNVPSMESSLLQSAKAATDKGEHVRAAQFYRQLAEKNPTYMADYGEAIRRAGQSKQAIVVFDQALAKDPQNLNAKEGKALALMNEGDFNKAAALFGEVMAADASRWRTINALGIILALNKRVPDSIEYFRAALKLNPSNPSILNNVGLALAINEDFPGAIKALEEASRQATGQPRQKKQVDLNLSLVYGLSGNLNMAERIARPHLSSAELNNNMGMFAAYANDKELAKSYLNKALAASPTYYEKAWENLESVQAGKSPTLSTPGKTVKAK